MTKLFLSLFCAMLALAAANAARAAGTTPLALVQQFDNQGNARPLSGCLLYFYQAGTVATPQQVFQDFGLSQPAPNPLQCDQGARVPMHWLADGLIHVRLTDASGVVQLDTTLQVLGPSAGGGGGGTTVDPTTVATTGDIKARLGTETQVPGWVILNGTTIGSSSSGANFAPMDNSTQALFFYLWQNCTTPSNTHCPVPGGRGASAQADWNANKQITLPDMRSRALVGRDCMGTGCVGLLLGSNITSGGTDGVDTVGAAGGAANNSGLSSSGNFQQNNLPTGLFFPVTGITLNDPQHQHSSPDGLAFLQFGGTGTNVGSGGSSAKNINTTTTKNSTGITINSFGGGWPPAVQGLANAGGSGKAFNVTSSAFGTIGPFLLVTWYMKL